MIVIILCTIVYLVFTVSLYAVLERTGSEGRAAFWSLFWPILLIILPFAGIAWLSYIITNYIIEKFKS